MSSTYFVSRLLTSGGDGRIRVPSGQNTNQYGSSPHPRSTLGYASSTANDISLAAFEHLCRLVDDWPDAAVTDAAFYADRLEGLRHRLRAAWQLPDKTDVIFAPSGTDLEFVALALSGPRTTNVLVGADEVGSGCILSAAGRYFARETALFAPVPKGDAVRGLEATGLHDIPVRDALGRQRASAEIARDIEIIAQGTFAQGRNCLAHIVYGSKTGLVLPALHDLDLLRRRLPGLRFVVDACQARITGADIRALLERDCIVLLTGSKFMGGPPFSGIALVPESCRPGSALPDGLATIYRRAEFPLDWTACDFLETSANPGLLLRLEAALFELEAFVLLDPSQVRRVTQSFASEVTDLAHRLGVKLVEPCPGSGALYTSTLATLNLTSLPTCPDLAVAQRWHRVLAARGLRLGQPVKCVRHPGGGWGGTLRLSLSMPLIAELAALDTQALTDRLGRDMRRIAEVIEAAQRAVVA